MRLARPLAPVVLLVVGLVAGCGSSDSTDGTDAGPVVAPPGARAKSCVLDVARIEGLRVTGVGCRTGQRVAIGWGRDPSCSTAAGTSRHGCGVGRYRCLSLTADRGTSVSCARPGRSISFIAKPD